MQKLKSNINLLLGTMILLSFLVMLIVSFFYTPYDVNEMQVENKLQAPSSAHLFGTDEFGRDIFSRVMKGSQTAFAVGLMTIAIGGFFGVLIGSIAGYAGGWIDEIFMRLMDALMAFPGIILALMLVAVFGPGIVNTSIALGIISIPSIARVTRSGFIQQKEAEYVTAAKLLGLSHYKIMVKHILPNVFPQILVALSVTFSIALLAEASLSYLGLGVQPPDPSWGRMLKDSQAYMTTSPWYTYAPGAAITLLVLGFYLMSNAIRDLSDPRSE